MHEKFLKGIVTLKDQPDLFENIENMSQIEAFLDFLTATKPKMDGQLKLRIQFVASFLDSQPNQNLYVRLLVFNKILEILRNTKNGIIFLTMIKNSVQQKPNYNILNNFVKKDGYDIYKILPVLFSDSNNLHNWLPVVQLMTQLGIEFKDLHMLICKYLFIEYILLNSSIKSNTWLKTFLDEAFAPNELFLYIERYLLSEE